MIDRKALKKAKEVEELLQFEGFLFPFYSQDPIVYKYAFISQGEPIKFSLNQPILSKHGDSMIILEVCDDYADEC